MSRDDHAMTDAGTSVASTTVDASAVRRAATRANPNWSLERTMSAVERFVCAIAAHVDDGAGGLAELHAFAELTHQIDGVVDSIARHLLEHDDASYREIGAALGISRQAAVKRYPKTSSRQPGGQPARLR